MEPAEAEQRRQRLIDIIQRHFASDANAATRAIKEATGQEVAVRTVQCWQIAPNRPSYRRAPEWAVSALEDYVKRLEKSEELLRHAEQVNKRQMSAAYGWDGGVEEVIDSKAVELATSEIEDDERAKQKWRERFGVHQGDALFEENRSLRRNLTAMSKDLAALFHAMRQAEDFETFKALAQAASQRNWQAENIVRREREAIAKDLVNPE